MQQPGGSHLTEYAIEAAALGAFLVSAACFTVLIEHPASPVRMTLDDALARRALIGVAMGATLIAIVYSRAGRRSGAHLNPVVTLTFLRLGKVSVADAVGYVTAQFAGAALVMAALRMAADAWLAHPGVRHVRTVPGPAGAVAAFAAEAAISFGMMLLILALSNSRWRQRTGLAAGALVAVYITLEAPLSGMSMNPARSAGPALAAGVFDGLWIYFVAPAVGMLAAAELFVRRRGLQAVVCAKLHHDDRARCIFRCGYAGDAGTAAQPQAMGQDEKTEVEP